MKTTFRMLVAMTLLSATSLSAQQAPPPENPNTYGRWEFSTENGFRGLVILDRGFCHYQVTSSFSSTQSRCFTSWSPTTNTLIILPPYREGGFTPRAFTVPDYQPSQGANTIASVGDASFTFQLDKHGRNFMRGHLIGPGEHETVTLRRH
jgi:hypothetical protein